MKIAPAAMLAGPKGRPEIEHPVLVALDCALFYLTDAGPQCWEHEVFCSRFFAETVLVLQEAWALKHKFAIVHLGFYAARQARNAKGKLIFPLRWSNHSYGNAEDFAGIITRNGKGDYLNIAAMETGCPAKLAALLRDCQNAIQSEGRRPEIVNERRWIHLGFFPARYDP